MTGDKPILKLVDIASATSAGALLRKAREAQGLHIAMLAVQLKVPVKRLEALEADRHEEFPDIVLVRALAASVCRVLKLDVEPVLAALPPSLAPAIRSDKTGLNTVFNVPPNGFGRTLRAVLGKPLGIAIVLLLLGILAIVFLPPLMPLDDAGMLPARQTGQTEPTLFQASPVGTEVNAKAMANAPQLSVATSFSLSDPIAAPMPSNATSQVTVAASDSTDQAKQNSTTVVSQGADVLTLQAIGASWVEVVDAKGALLLRTTLKRGDIAPVTGALPLAVVLGRADSVLVRVRGQVLDTTAMTHDYVARFEVK